MERRSADIFAPGFKTQPFWWDAAPRPTLPEASLPARADVAVVGSGYTGLSAALTLAHAGRSVVVLEKSEAGFGASTRNAGFVGRTFKHSFPELAATKGTDHAIAVFRELQAAFDYVVTLIETEKIDCDFRRCGRLIVANAPRHYDQIAAMLALKQKHLGEPYEMVPKAELHRELASDLYYGGAVLPDLGSLHSGLYHQGLMERVLARRPSVTLATAADGRHGVSQALEQRRVGRRPSRRLRVGGDGDRDRLRAAEHRPAAIGELHGRVLALALGQARQRHQLAEQPAHLRLTQA